MNPVTQFGVGILFCTLCLLISANISEIFPTFSSTMQDNFALFFVFLGIFGITLSFVVIRE